MKLQQLLTYSLMFTRCHFCNVFSINLISNKPDFVGVFWLFSKFNQSLVSFFCSPRLCTSWHLVLGSNIMGKTRLTKHFIKIWISLISKCKFLKQDAPRRLSLGQQLVWPRLTKSLSLAYFDDLWNGPAIVCSRIK